MESIGKQLKEFEEIDIILENKTSYSGPSLFKCILGLNETEAMVFGFISKNKDVGTMELTNVLKKDRSNIQRALKSLTELKVITRDSMSMKNYVENKKIKDSKKQGYLFVYNVKDMDLIKAHFKKILDKWYTSMIKYVDELDDICKNCNLNIKK